MAKALKSLLVRRRPRQQLQQPPSPKREESFESLDRCPDDSWKRTLMVNHQKLRSEIRVNDVLPRFHSFLTNVEYLRVQGSDKADNIDQVDQLFRILITKEKRDFEEFLVALCQQGYAGLAARLAKAAGVELNTPSGMATAVDRDVSLPARARIPSVVLNTPSGMATAVDTDVSLSAKSQKHAMKEKGMLYYPLIESLHDAFYKEVIIPFEAFVMKSTNADFRHLRRVCEQVIRREEHPIACKVHLPTQREQFLDDLECKHGLWKDALEYQLLREVIMAFHDEGLTLRLKQYEALLHKEGNTILMQCQREFRRCPDLCLVLKADHNTALATLRRLKSFLVNDVGLADASFAGFREGCIELFFRISSESASTALDPLCSHAFRAKLLSMGVRRVTLRHHWVINTDTGHVFFLQSPESLTDHDPEDSTADVTHSSEMTTSIAGHSGRLSDLEDVPFCKRVKLNAEEEDAPVFQPSHSIEWQAAQEDSLSILLQSKLSGSCVKPIEETMEAVSGELVTGFIMVPEEERSLKVPEEERSLKFKAAIEEQRKLKVQLHAARSVGSAKCSAVRRKRRRCRATRSGTILLPKTTQQHATLPNVELTNEAVALKDSYSGVSCLHFGVDESLVMSVSNFSPCTSEQLQNTSVENLAEVLEEVFPASKHGSTEQVQSFDNEGDEQAKPEGPCTLWMQQSAGSQDVILHEDNTQVGSDAQSEDY